jgi:hypothetical protein
VVKEALYAGYASAGQGRKIELPFRPEGVARPIDLWLGTPGAASWSYALQSSGHKTICGLDHGIQVRRETIRADIQPKVGLRAKGSAAYEHAKFGCAGTQVSNQLDHVRHVEQHSGRDAQQIRILRQDGIDDAAMGSIRAKKLDVPPGIFEYIGYHVRADLMQLTVDTRDNCVTQRSRWPHRQGP